jgi:hypothetical protein
MPRPWLYIDLETIDSIASLEIEALRLPDEDEPWRSGRIHTCDAFPPAAWVEGGVGMDNCNMNSVPNDGFTLSRFAS